MSMKEMTAGLLLLSLAACSDGAPQAMNKGGMQENGAAQIVAADAVPANAPIIVAFGDSLYAGYGVQQDQGFAPELQRALAARGVVGTGASAAAVSSAVSAGATVGLVAWIFAALSVAFFFAAVLLPATSSPWVSASWGHWSSDARDSALIPGGNG